jgi:hypothetical protein
MAKATYPVLGALRLDGKDYTEGDEVEMETKAAKPLVEAAVLGAATATPVEKAAEKTAENAGGKKPAAK